MTERILFKLTKRDIIGKKVRQLRKGGIVPAVVYGLDHESFAVQADSQEIEKLIQKVGTTTPFYVELNDKKRLAIVKQLNRDPIRRLVSHVDFQTISAKEHIETEIPIKLTHLGESEAERAGLIVMQVLEEIAVKALPVDMVSHIDISIADLKKVGEKITIGDITLPKGLEFADKEIDLNLTIVNVYDPAEIEAANEAAGGDATEETEVLAENGAVDQDQAASETESKTPEKAKTDKKDKKDK